MSFQDEFGGYSSRLRLHSSKRQKIDETESDDKMESLELNLCEMLGIDVEAIAKRIAMGIDTDSESQDDEAKIRTAVSFNDSSNECSHRNSPFKGSSINDLKPSGELMVAKKERSHSSSDLLKEKIVTSASHSTQESQIS